MKRAVEIIPNHPHPNPSEGEGMDISIYLCKPVEAEGIFSYPYQLRKGRFCPSMSVPAAFGEIYGATV